ncbi:MAG: JAB domain-containing protein [Odoribacter sp.]|nr:JAB domain-containing protein [Odoribacter sp.]
MTNKKNWQQVCELTVTYKPKVKAADRYLIRSSEDACKLLMQSAFHTDTLEYKEYVKLVLLNNANRVLGIATISEGGMNSTVVDIRLILQTALLAHATAIILAHNHPSGEWMPSRHDDMITKKIKEATGVVDIILHDHIIVTRDGYYSYKDEGKL